MKKDNTGKEIDTIIDSPNNENNNELVKKSKRIIVSQFILKAIMVIVSIITILIGVFSIGKTAYFITDIGFASEKCLLKNDIIWFNIVFCLIILATLYFICKKVLPKINEKLLLLLVLIFSLAISLVWVNYIKYKPISDQSMVVYSAGCILERKCRKCARSGAVS